MAKLLGKWIDDRAIGANHILLANDAYVLGRDNANLADLQMMKINAADLLEFGIEPVFAAAPSTSASLANKAYVDSAVFGMRDPKDAVRLVAVGNVSVASPGTNIDGAVVAVGDRIGLVAQTDPSENGIYTFVASNAPMTRTLDADADAEVTQGLSFLCAEGTNNAYKTYALVTADPIVVGTTALSFVQIPSLGNILLFKNPIITLVALDISNGYVDLAQEADANSIELSPVGGIQQEIGVDYILSVVANVTRITFAADLAAQLVATDKLSLQYVYQP